MAGFSYFAYLNLAPTVRIPTPTLPSPNGHDVIASVSSTVVRWDDVDWAASEPYEPCRRTYTLAEKDALVAANARALTALHTALRLPYWSPPVRSTSTPMMPELAKFYRLARLLSLEAKVREAHGDYRGAVNSRLDAIDMGIAIPRGGIIFAQLTGLSCEATGARDVWDDMDHLTADESAIAARRLQETLDRRVPFVDAQREQKWFDQANLKYMFSGKNSFAALTNLLDQFGFTEYGQQNEGMRWAMYGQLLTHSKRRILADYTRMEDAYIAMERLPYAPRRPTIPIPNDPFNRLLDADYTRWQFRDYRTQMQNNLLTAAIALRAYRLRYNHYPVALEELTATHLLRHLPIDPFAPAFNTPLRYRTLPGNGYLLYSVGPDGKDDGGEPIPRYDLHAQGYRPPMPRRDDRGDWVVGVNVGATKSR